MASASSSGTYKFYERHRTIIFSFFFFNIPYYFNQQYISLFSHFSPAFNSLSCTLMLFSKKKGAMHIFMERKDSELEHSSKNYRVILVGRK